MGRALRIEYPGALYHIMSHGNGNQWLYKSKKELDLFKKVVKDIVKKYKFKIHAIVIMRNHYHILLETPLPNLSLGMKKFNQEFAKLYNKSNQRRGSVFRDRYKAILIEKELYYWNVLRYIIQNPLRINIVERCEDYRGSFLNWLLKDKTINEYIYLSDIKSHFNIKGKKWIDLLFEWGNMEKENKPKSTLKPKYLLGSDKWAKKISKKIKSTNLDTTIIERKKYYEIFLDENKLNKICKPLDKKLSLKIKIYFYNKYSSLTHKEIAEKLKIKSSNSCRQKYYIFSKQINLNKNLQKKIDTIKNIVI